MTAIRKYPRTPHLAGSRLQPGDEDLDSVPLDDLAGRYLVVAEKLDGANAGVSFDAAGRLLLQSRGHYLGGGPREKHFALFKQWAGGIAHQLAPVLTDRYILYGEWLYAKHTIFYDLLPAYFLEFDVLDAATETFLSTAARRELLAGLPVSSVPVLFEGVCDDPARLVALVGPARYKSPQWRDALALAAARRGVDPEQARRETDPSDRMEGLYVKAEDAGAVAARYKYVRADFLTAVADSGSHWLRRPIIPNSVLSASRVLSAEC